MKEKELYNSILEAVQQEQGGKYSVQMLLLLLLIGGVIFASAYLVRNYILPFLESRKTKARAELTLFRLEVSSWGVFTLFALYELMRYNIWLTVILVLVTGICGLNFFKDFFPGLIYRIEERFKVGDLLRLGEYSGEVMSIGVRNLQLKTEDEELILVPYASITNKEIVKLQAKGRLISTKLTYQVERLLIDKIKTELPNWLRACPWAVVNESVHITETEEETLNITVYAVDQKSVGRIDDFLLLRIKEALESK